MKTQNLDMIIDVTPTKVAQTKTIIHHFRHAKVTAKRHMAMAATKKVPSSDK